MVAKRACSTKHVMENTLSRPELQLSTEKITVLHYGKRLIVLIVYNYVITMFL